MDSFLRKEKPPTGEGREKKGCGGVGETPSGLAKPGAGAVPENLLFNPQPRQRQSSPRLTIGSTAHEEVINGQGGGRGRGCGGSGGSGGSSASSYWEARTSKLSEQAPSAKTQIFAGLSFYFTGRSGEKQTMHLKGAVSRHGGRTTPFMSMKGVTHVIAENLSAAKTDKAMKSLKMKVVHPDWLTRCIAEGRLLSDAPFRVVRSQKLAMSNFFRASSSSCTSVRSHCADGATGSQKENTGQRQNYLTSGKLRGGGSGAGGEKERKRRQNLAGCAFGASAATAAERTKEIGKRHVRDVGLQPERDDHVGRYRSSGGSGSGNSKNFCEKDKDTLLSGNGKAMGAIPNGSGVICSTYRRPNSKTEAGVRVSHGVSPRKRCRVEANLHPVTTKVLRIGGDINRTRSRGGVTSPSRARKLAKEQHTPSTEAAALKGGGVTCTNMGATPLSGDMLPR